MTVQPKGRLKAGGVAAAGPLLGWWRAAPEPRRRALRITAIAMAAYVAWEGWAIILNQLRGYRYTADQLPGQVAAMLVWTLLCLACAAFVRRSSAMPPVARIVLAAVVLAGVSTVYNLALRAIGAVTPVAMTVGYNLQVALWETLYWLFPFASWTLLIIVLERGRQVRARDERLSAALIHAAEAELRALRYQVNPHFLYNAINAVVGLVSARRNAQAEEMLVRLSQYYRGSLSEYSLADVPLKHEFDHQRLYLELEQFRFADRLVIHADLPAAFERALVPGLILQPLLENAVKHGIHPPGKQTRIALEVSAEGQALVITVQDNGPGAPASAAPGTGAPGTGVGLDNVRQRLAARYGAAARLETSIPDTGGFRARVTLPLTFAPDPDPPG